MTLAAAIASAYSGNNHVARELGTAEFHAELGTSLILKRGTGSPTFTRATTALVADNEGIYRQVPSGCARFTGARMVRNLLAAPTSTMATQNVTTVAGAYTLSFYGTGSVALSGTVTDNLAGTGASTRVQKTVTATAGTLTLTVTGSVTNAQLEHVQSQADQTASEYVAVGAVPSPTTDNYLRLPGVASNYASTPDSVAASITGDIDIRVKVAFDDWTPAAINMLVSKLMNVGQYAYDFFVATTGELTFRVSLDGTAISTAVCTVATSIADYATSWVRVTRASATGNVNFYTSSDGSAWTLLGGADVATSAGSIKDGSDALAVGASSGGGSNYATGKIYRAQIYSGIAGTLKVDFNPTLFTGSYNGATMTAATGEVWTLNSTAPTTMGGARITSDPWIAFGYPNANSGGGADGVSFFATNKDGTGIASTTLLGYFPEGSRQNIVLQSSNFGTTWAAAGSPTRSAGAVVRGALVLDLIGDDGGAALEGYTQTITFTADAVKSVSFVIKKGTATSSVVQLVDTTATANRLLLAITWTGAVPTVTYTTGSAERAIKDCGDGVYRVFCLTTAVTAANTNSLRVYPATDSALDVAATGNLNVGCMQAENALFASSHIPTTTAAVTRNADVLTYPSAGNVLGTVGSIYCGAIWNRPPGASYSSLVATGSSGRILGNAGHGSLWGMFDGTNATSSASTPSISTQYKVAASWQGNYKLAVNGTSLIAEGTFDGEFNIASGTIIIGTNIAGGSDTLFYGNIKNVRIWQRQLSSTALAAITA